MAGKIDFPGDFEDKPPRSGIKISAQKAGVSGTVRVLDGFPEKIEGEVIFCHQDNLNTDGIYPGKYTYIDDFTPEQQAEVVMENYDPEFGKLVKAGDILAGGFNFGTGSSREQAATALKYRGIRMVIAGSFSETYKRNALNNGYLIIEVPEFIRDLKTRFGDKKLTVCTGHRCILDVRQSILEFDGKGYAVGPVGAAAQELILAGGLEKWVKGRI